MEKTVSEADIVITACGVPGLVPPHWIKEGTIAIDVGISFHDQEGSKPLTSGDIQFCEETL